MKDSFSVKKKSVENLPKKSVFCAKSAVFGGQFSDFRSLRRAGGRGTLMILLPEDDPEKQRPETGNEACQGVEKIRHPVFELPGGNWSDLS